MKCCQSEILAAEFNERIASRELRSYRRRGPSKTTGILIGALREVGVEGRTLLDIGGGVGTISHELLRLGVSRADSVDASDAYLAAARTESKRQGHADRLSLHYGDFVTLAETVPPADIVTLDRVVCCYPHMPALVEASVARSRTVYGLVYPRDRWWIKLGVRAANCLFRVRRRRFRAFVHSAAEVDALVRNHGMTMRFRQVTAIWQVVVYSRA